MNVDFTPGEFTVDHMPTEDSVENSSKRPHGLPVGFNLGTIIGCSMQDLDGDIYPLAVAAANHVAERYYTDEKTGLLNEKGFVGRLTSEIDSLGKEEVIVLYMADLDRFKAVNDELGHVAGDRLLLIVAQAFKQTFERKTDSIARGSRENIDGIGRFGGDEFAVFTTHKKTDLGNDNRHPDVGEEPEIQCQKLNEVLCNLISGTEFDHFKLNISIASVQIKQGDDVLSTLIAADRAMLEKKKLRKIAGIRPEDEDGIRDAMKVLQRHGIRPEGWLFGIVS